MDSFEKNILKRRYAKLFEKLVKKTKFTSKELLTLALLHYKVTNISPIDRRLFRVVLHNCLDMTDDTLLDRIFVAIDTKSDNVISLSEFICGFSIFLRGTQKQQIEYCFSVYDTLDEGRVGRDHIFQLLRNSIILASSIEESEEGAKDLVDFLLKRCDKDKDGRLSLEDFRSSVAEDPLLLEALGPCLPSRPAVNAFQMVFYHNPCGCFTSRT